MNMQKPRDFFNEPEVSLRMPRSIHDSPGRPSDVKLLEFKRLNLISSTTVRDMLFQFLFLPNQDLS